MPTGTRRPHDWEHRLTPSTHAHAGGFSPPPQTYHGIDGCGDRLVQEILELVAAHPELQELSIIGHSMGGLIARYAVGRLYDPETGLLAGQLRPVHFISMACPHCGCVAEPSHAQVGRLVGWLGWVTVAVLGGSDGAGYRC